MMRSFLNTMCVASIDIRTARHRSPQRKHTHSLNIICFQTQEPLMNRPKSVNPECPTVLSYAHRYVWPRVSLSLRN
ncbi:hypothetical protein Bealeia2_02089 (plasmid) [Candidatus Bealeia paramacronuclearis]|nr:hypothetical protein [Candidatus Bealeia paramacronuclearis]